jgi:hypothetical protein
MECGILNALGRSSQIMRRIQASSQLSNHRRIGYSFMEWTFHVTFFTLSRKSKSLVSNMVMSVPYFDVSVTLLLVRSSNSIS